MTEKTFGRYKVVGELGRGAMGAVYRAVDPLIERDVAIKTLLPNVPEEAMDEVRERFIREAAQVLRPRGRLYLVANRFLKYEPRLQTCFQSVGEVGGNTRYKVLRAMNPIMRV